MVEDRHVIETLGKVEVVIENGEITSVGSSEMTYCPMFHAMHGVDELNEEFIRKNINFRIEDFGMCTPDRVVEMDDAVTVGISEILKTNMEKGNIDCVVGACDGAGTLLMTFPSMMMSPLSGVSSPAIMRRIVVLPEPLGPKRPMSLPFSIPKETSSEALKFPKCLLMCFSSTYI